MQNNIRKNFTQVPNELINETGLTRDARFLFCYLCSKPDDWKFYTKTVEKELVCSKDSRVKYMKELINAGWISTKQKIKPGGLFGANEIVLNPYPKKPATVKQPQPKKTAADKNGGGNVRPLNNNNTSNNIDLFKKEEIPVLILDEFLVLKYLNEKKPSKRPFSELKENINPIKAALKKKFSVEDLKKVIDLKVKEWNTDKMKKFIRPETLFGKKFESYLVEAEEQKTSKGNGAGSSNFTEHKTTLNDLK